ncbi:hypothetical protein PLANPX_1889 [Lacipirellula parvula]|uniref:Uncharacterized protein n=1 Tax=Lacipirellula parvula TaxID=2650471 RepID=A0A5K7X8T4_9BACT|nr:hypothetical protein PLANPX_1889 [Lacipirellula parvula]
MMHLKNLEHIMSILPLVLILLVGIFVAALVSIGDSSH